jgi:hypothetical protein
MEMPRQIFNKDELLRLAYGAKECRVVRRGIRLR